MGAGCRPGRPEAPAVTDRRTRAIPVPGGLVFVGASASVQFAGAAGFNFRVIRVDDRPTYTHWCWLEGYQLDAQGRAVERRSIFVRTAGLRPPARQK